MAWTIGETARLAKVSVRTLHHYDQLGILTPSARSDAGYRLYGPEDLERLHRVMVFRELGFSLPEIGHIVTDPDFDHTEALRAQRALLAEKARRTSEQLAAIDAALAATEGGTQMSDEERKEMFGELFDGFDPAEYEDEVQERWGESDAYKQSAARAKRYTKADWAQMKAEGDANTEEFIRLMDASIAADSPRRWPPLPRSTPRSRSGSTTPRWRCSRTWRTCGSTIRGSRRTSTSPERDWPSTSAPP